MIIIIKITRFDKQIPMSISKNYKIIMHKNTPLNLMRESHLLRQKTSMAEDT